MGIYSELCHLPANSSQQEVQDAIAALCRQARLTATAKHSALHAAQCRQHISAAAAAALEASERVQWHAH